MNEERFLPTVQIVENSYLLTWIYKKNAVSCTEMVNGVSSKLFLAIYVIFLFTAVAAAEATPPEIPSHPEGEALLEEALTLAISRRGTDTQIFDLIDEAERVFSEIPDRYERSYWISRTNLARGIRHNQLERSRDAERALERGFVSIERSMEDGLYSEGLRVLADLHAQMLNAKGLFYMIRNGNEAREAALEALDRAPRNIKAQITVAGFLLNAPPMAGGDTEQARLVLESALAQEPASRNDRFLILGWLAQASHELDDLEAAERYFAEAYSIYPESEWLADIGDEISE